MRTPRRKHAGFTLIEMMCAVAVVGVLSSIAYPSYLSVVHKVRRCDALVAVMQVQMAQERFRSASPRYGSLADIGVADTTPSRHYTLSMVQASPTGYQVLATASGAQVSDEACRYMRLTVDGLHQTLASGPTTELDNPAQVNKKCWSQ